MADHDELVSEMPILETMGTQERQKLAKKRRLQQLKRWSQREKEWIAKEKQLNKRFANIMSEENNGLNLKQYTAYNSNQRTKRKLVSSNNNNNNYLNDSNTAHGKTRPTNGSIKIEYSNNCTINGPYSNSLSPNSRVHFNVGVMLLEAASRNDYDEVKRLLSLGVSPDSVNHDGLTALHQCCIDASEPIMQLLLDYGASVDARDTEQWTPLHAACTCGHLNLVKILVEHGADLLAVNGDGNMPFDICEDEATLDYIENQMVKQGITQEMIDLTRASNELNMLKDLEKLASECPDEINRAVDDNGVTPLHIAATNNYLSVVKFMLNHGVNVSVCDNDLWQPLHGVACWGNEQHIKVVELLVEAGANLDAKTFNDETVFDLCDNVELLEHMNQLKDELESKQATGTERLRRTQSRTNSRVHSVRRTSVRDKNQISRREAREEAMLRVDSNTDIPPQASLAPPDSQQQCLVESASNGTDSKRDSHTVTISVPQNQTIAVTDLDEPDASLTLVTDDDICRATDNNSGNERDVSPMRKPDGRDTTKQNGTDIPLASTASRGATDRASQPDVVQSRLSTVPTIKVNVTHRSQNTRDSASNLAGDTPGLVKSTQHKQPNTTTVQVQFTPTNYTLSNLKKHRSDLRMRNCSIGAAISSTSLNTVEELSPTNARAPGASSRGSKSVIGIHEDIKIEPALGSTPGNNLDRRVSNEHLTGKIVTQMRSGSPSSNFRKFHGQPSEVPGGESIRKIRRKRCAII